jgi:hypothetical protein
MDFQIALLLGQDGITNGAIYALLALALVLVFAVTRVIFIPQGEFVAYGALTLVMIQAGAVPATVWLLLGAGVLAAALDAIAALRAGQPRCAPASRAARRPAALRAGQPRCAPASRAGSPACSGGTSPFRSRWWRCSMRCRTRISRCRCRSSSRWRWWCRSGRSCTASSTSRSPPPRC